MIHIIKMSVPEITPSAYAALADPPAILDVREADEVAICALPFKYHIPVGELQDRVGELDPDEPLVVLCRVGHRSGYAVALLVNAGFSQVWNLKGGILAYREDIDPSLATY